MNEPKLDPLEIRLEETARQMAYPPTPNLAGQINRRLRKTTPRSLAILPRPAWALLALVMVLLACLSVPPVRAALLEFIQVGAIRIRLTQPTALPTLTLAPTRPAGTASPAEATAEPTLTSTSSPTARPVLDRLAGETTLAEAERSAGFEILLPTYPEDLGDPARVYSQKIGGPAVLLLWFEPSQPNLVRLSLLILTNQTLAIKGEPRVLQITQVNGEQALWTEGAHVLELAAPSDMAFEKFIVSGHVLIWTQGDLTYRLETSLDLEETIRMAESLR
jgi:hypothetical protein